MYPLACDVIVLGGGAAGICAAIAAARQGASVYIVEKHERLGRSILSTGNGRCNLSNASIVSGSATAAGVLAYNNPEFVSAVLSSWDHAAVCRFFERLGLLVDVDERGWAYPHTRWANTVLDVLLLELGRLGVKQLASYEALLIRDDNGDYGTWRLSCMKGDDIDIGDIVAPCAVVATRRWPQASGLDNLGIVPLQPVLGPLSVPPAAIRGLDGIRARCRVSLLSGGSVVSSELGEVHFRKDSVSGIAAFNLSRHAKPGMELCLDLMAERDAASLRQILLDRLSDFSSLMAADCLRGMLHPRLATAVFRQCGISERTAVSVELTEKLTGVMKGFCLEVTGLPPWKQAQAIRGGYSTACFASDTLEAHDYPGLFAAGECLDVDGPCGGYNLHWAWASGLVAGEAAARRAGKRPAK